MWKVPNVGGFYGIGESFYDWFRIDYEGGVLVLGGICFVIMPCPVM